MHRSIVGLFVSACLIWFTQGVNAATLSFENFATGANGGLALITPDSPYTEAGFTLTPSSLTNPSFVVDSTSPLITMAGNNSDWFAFLPDSGPILTRSYGGTFNLTSLLLGPGIRSDQVGLTPIIDITIVGILSNGGTLTQTYNQLTTATSSNLNWTDLIAVQFSTTDPVFAAGLDNIVVQVPEPDILVLIGLGMILLGLQRHSSWSRYFQVKRW